MCIDDRRNVIVPISRKVERNNNNNNKTITITHIDTATATFTTAMRAEEQGADLLLSLAAQDKEARKKVKEYSAPTIPPAYPSSVMMDIGVGSSGTTTHQQHHNNNSKSSKISKVKGETLADNASIYNTSSNSTAGMSRQQLLPSPIRLSGSKETGSMAADFPFPSYPHPPPPPPSWMSWQSPARASPSLHAMFGSPFGGSPAGTGATKRSADSPAVESPPKKHRRKESPSLAVEKASGDQIIISPSSSNDNVKAEDDDEHHHGGRAEKHNTSYHAPPPYYMLAQGYEAFAPRPPYGYPYTPYPGYYSVPPGPGGATYPPMVGPPNTAASTSPTAGASKSKGVPLTTSMAPGTKRCVPLEDPTPPKKWSDWDEYKDAKLPDFHRLVNFPDYISRGRHSVDKSAPAGKKRCVMCGNWRLCSGASRAAREEGGSDTTNHIIPRQNKGVCTACDVAVWVVLESKNLQIKWCKGCKNFRNWPAFGEKGLATKCVRCRERQKEKYASQKHERRHMVGKKDDDIAAHGLAQLRAT